MSSIPNHVAIVMDGNGRWAKERGLPRTEGHKAGEASLLDVVYGCLEKKVSYLSAFAFSTENWNRSPEEVRFLMGFNRDVIRRRRDELHDIGVRIRWIGRRKKLWKSVQEELDEAVELTRRNRKLTLTMCVNYGGQSEIVDAVQRIAQKVESSELESSAISEKNFAKYLYDKDLPAVDLLIRTSGEVRISNFLLWQSAYAELVFDETLWPDYRRENLFQALEIYRKRTRRFGTA